MLASILTIVFNSTFYLRPSTESVHHQILPFVFPKRILISSTSSSLLLTDAKPGVLAQTLQQPPTCADRSSALWRLSHLPQIDLLRSIGWLIGWSDDSMNPSFKALVSGSPLSKLLSDSGPPHLFLCPEQIRSLPPISCFFACLLATCSLNI